MYLKLVTLVIATCVAACGPKVVKPTSVESSTGCPEACRHMKDKFPECPEGKDPQCVPGCERIFNLGYIWTDNRSGPMCIATTTTMDELHACNVECRY